MNEFQLRHTLLLLLVAAFLPMQWASVHIHLTQQHSHGGSPHQHQLKTHAHNLISPLHVTIDVGHHANHANVVDLDDPCTLIKKETPKNASPYVVATVFYPPPPLLLAGIKIPAITNTKLSYFSRSILNPRAPPQIS